MTDDLALWYCRSIASSLVAGNEQDAVSLLRETSTHRYEPVNDGRNSFIDRVLWRGAILGIPEAVSPNPWRIGGVPAPFTPAK